MHTQPGQSHPLGATLYPGGVNFCVYSKNSKFKYSPEQRHEELKKQFEQFSEELASGEKVARALLGEDYPEERLPNSLLVN